MTTTNVYDLGGRRTFIINPRGTITQYEYDANDRLDTVTTDIGGYEFETVYDYDSNGNRTGITDPESNTKEWGYDNANRLIAMTDGESNLTTYDLDSNGNRTLVTDGNTHTTRNTYDKLNRLTLVEVDPTGLDLTTQYFYTDSGGGGSCGCGGASGKGLIRHVVDADSNHIWYTYDELDRKTAEIRKVGDTDEDADTNDAVTTYTYDAEGHVTLVSVDPTGLNLTTTKTYDKAGRLVSSIVDAGTSGLNLTTLYDYDSNGNTLHMKNPAGDATTNTYDAANRRTESSDSLGLLDRVEYDENGNVTKRAIHDATTDRATVYVFDALDRMTTQTDPNGQATRYTYYDAGKVHTIMDANSHYTTYTYDGNCRPGIV